MQPSIVTFASAVGAALLAFGACGDSSEPDPLAALRAASATPVDARVEHGLLRHALGRFATSDPTAFVAAHADLFGLDDVATDLSEPELATDGAHRSWTYHRLTAGLPVHGAQLRVHAHGDHVVLVQAQLPADAHLATTTPTLTPDDASARLNEHLGVDADAPAAQVDLVAFNEGVLTGDATGTVLAYRVASTAYALDAPVGFVDATTGALLWSHHTIVTARDRRVAHYRDDPLCADYCDLNDVLSFARDVWFTEEGSLPDAEPSAAGSLAFNLLGDLYDYYHDAFGRDGMDGRGGTTGAYLNHPVEASPHDALYAHDLGAIFVRDAYVSRTVIGHEYAHGVITASSGLGVSGRAGALHEALADVLSVLAAGPDEWAVRDASGALVRDLRDPAISQAGSYIPLIDSEHKGGGPFSLAIYLLVTGGAHPTVEHPPLDPVGAHLVEQVIYRTVTRYLQPRSDQADAVVGLVRACVDLVDAETPGFDLRQCGAIWNAFATVGLGERDEDRDTVVDRLDNCPEDFNPSQEPSACEEPDPACDDAKRHLCDNLRNVGCDTSVMGNAVSGVRSACGGQETARFTGVVEVYCVVTNFGSYDPAVCAQQ